MKNKLKLGLLKEKGITPLLVANANIGANIFIEVKLLQVYEKCNNQIYSIILLQITFAILVHRIYDKPPSVVVWSSFHFRSCSPLRGQREEALYLSNSSHLL